MEMTVYVYQIYEDYSGGLRFVVANTKKAADREINNDRFNFTYISTIDELKTAIIKKGGDEYICVE